MLSVRSFALIKLSIKVDCGVWDNGLCNFMENCLRSVLNSLQLSEVLFSNSAFSVILADYLQKIH